MALRSVDGLYCEKKRGTQEESLCAARKWWADWASSKFGRNKIKFCFWTHFQASQRSRLDVKQASGGPAPGWRSMVVSHCLLNIVWSQDWIRLKR